MTKGTVGKFIQTFDSWTENTSKSQVNSIHHPSFRTVCQGVFIGPLTSLWTYKMTKMPFGLLHWSELLTYITKGEVVISTFFKSNSSIYASWNLIKHLFVRSYFLVFACNLHARNSNSAIWPLNAKSELWSRSRYFDSASWRLWAVFEPQNFVFAKLKL